MRVAILNAGEQTDYLVGLVGGLAPTKDLRIDVVDSDNSAGLFDALSSVRFHNLRGSQRPDDPPAKKIAGILFYYCRLLWFAVVSDAGVFHIQWDNSILLFDRTLLLLWYKLCGRKIVFTAHNLYKEERDGRPSALRRLSLRAQYGLVDRIIVHTDAMKSELTGRFGVRSRKVRVIPHGINDHVPARGLRRPEARKLLRIPSRAKVLLFFGFIDRYKGLDILGDAFRLLRQKEPGAFLLVAGKVKRDSDENRDVVRMLKSESLRGAVRADFGFIPPESVEKYFAAADCLVLPYRQVSQSGVLFLAYRFGVPVIATDRGSFAQILREDRSGLVSLGSTAADLARTIAKYLKSAMAKKGEKTRREIRTMAESKYSWTGIGEKTAAVYREVLGTRA